MRLGTQQYLVLERNGSQRHRVSVVTDLKSALTNWEASTRISPIFPVLFGEDSAPPTDPLLGKKLLLLLGPLHPDEFLRSLKAPPAAMWMGYGILNLTVLLDSPREKSAVLRLAKSRGLAFEVWGLEDGVDRSVLRSETRQIGEAGAALGRLSARPTSPEIREALAEYCPLMASTITRGKNLPANIQENLARTQSFVEHAVKKTEQAKDDGDYRLLGQLLAINAGLSRFSSQTFAGTVPVFETECHFWSHSLLGIGVASIGLFRITEFLESTLGTARLPERFAELSLIDREIPDLCRLDVNDPFWTADHLGRVKLGTKDPEPIVPLIAYFSARDGFRSTSTTISAPLASIAACNSQRWTLLTITHEVSHILVRGMLSSLYPDFDSKPQIDRCLETLQSQKGDTLLQEISRLLFVHIIKIDQAHSQREEALELDSESFVDLLQNWNRDVEEIFVHVFDFLYFYGNDAERYIRGIWSSWGTIPNINARIPDYVVRTISAMLTNHLRRPGGEGTARDLVVRTLSEMQKSGAGGTYIQIALDYIEHHWKEIKERVLARKGLVKIAKTFFFSESVATSVRREPEISGGASDREGYTLKVGHLDLRAIGNPLRFLELYSMAAQPSAIESLWIYHVLTFCVERPK